MLLLVFDIRKPWLGTAGVPEKILLVDGILIGLFHNRIVNLSLLADQNPASQLTIK